MKLKDITALIIDPSASVSHAIVSVIKKGGCADVHMAANYKEADVLLSRHKIDWIVTSGTPSSGITLLEFLTKLHQKNTTVRVSAFFQAQELNIIPEAFALGLLSWHPSFFSIKKINDEITTLFTRLDAIKELDTAAEYLKSFLNTVGAKAEQVNLCRSIASHDIENYEKLISLAESLFINKETDEAVSTLARATYFSDGLGPEALALEERFKEDIADLKGKALNIAIVDGDDVSNAQVKTSLAALNANFEVYHTADQALIEMTKEPDLIICEWKLRGLSGQKFVQRLRANNFIDVPIVVISSSLSGEDHNIARECSISRIVPKPFSKESLLSSTRWAIAQQKTPTEDRSIEDKVIKELRQGNDARSYLALYKGKRRLFLEGAILYTEKNYKEAHEKLMAQLKVSRGERDVDVLSYLSKTLIELGATDAAIKLAEKAFDMSPKNIEKACDVAHMLYKIGRDKDAEIVTGLANELDRGNSHVLKLTASKAILNGDLPHAKSLLSKLGAVESVVSIINNKAVSLVRSGKGGEAEKLYKEALQVIDNGEDSKRSVYYNLALLQVKNGRNDEAKESLNQTLRGASKEYVGKEVYRKAYSLHQRLKNHKGGFVPLKTGEDDEVSHLYVTELSDLIGNGRYRHLAGKGIGLGFIYVPMDPGNLDAFDTSGLTISEDGLVPKETKPEIKATDGDATLMALEYEDITEDLNEGEAA